jgi:hypothetical protein
MAGDWNRKERQSLRGNEGHEQEIARELRRTAVP